MHSEEPPPPLPRRRTYQAISAPLRLWGEAGCRDLELLELCLEGLRALDTSITARQPTV